MNIPVFNRSLGLKHLKPNFQAITISLFEFRPGYPKRAHIHFLDAMFKHWTINFVEYVVTHVNFVVRVDSNNVDVVGRVVNLAQTQAIRV